jgi:hypothetical protein
MLWQRVPERFRYPDHAFPTSIRSGDNVSNWEAYNFIYQQTGQHHKVGKIPDRLTTWNAE